MDLDAVFLFKRVLKNYELTDHDYLLMLSAINNKTININDTLYNNFIASSIEFSDAKFLDKSEPYCNTPIYVLLLGNSDLRDLLIAGYASGNITSESLLQIMEICLSSLKEISEDEEEKIINFLTELISKRRKVNVEIFQKSQIIANYVRENDYLVIRENDYLANHTKKCFNIRIFILKLFAYGLVNFDYRVLSGDDPEPLASYQNIIVPLIRSRNFAHLRLIFNTKIIIEGNVDYIVYLVENTFKELYTREVGEEDQKKDMKIIEYLNSFLKISFPGRYINMIPLNNHAKKLLF